MHDEELLGGKLYNIPHEPEVHRDMLCIDRSTKEILRQKHRLYSNTDWESNTIAATTIETVCQVLYSHIVDNGVSILNDENDQPYINFYDLLEVTPSNKRNKKAEKNGNINVVFYPGSRVDEIIGDNTPVEDRTFEYITAEAAYSYPDDADLTNAMLKIDKIARKILADKNSIILPKDYMAIATTVIFLEELYRELVKKSVMSGKRIVSINFNNIVEFHATRKDDGLVITATPGMCGKRIIKSDKSTEDDMDEE